MLAAVFWERRNVIAANFSPSVVSSTVGMTSCQNDGHESEEASITRTDCPARGVREIRAGLWLRLLRRRVSHAPRASERCGDGGGGQDEDGGEGAAGHGEVARGALLVGRRGLWNKESNGFDT